MPSVRAHLLRSLILYELPIEPTVAKLASFGWDCNEPEAWLSADDIATVLRRFVTGELNAAQVTDWADLVECREDIDFVQGQEELAEVIFQLANPNLREEISLELIARLQAKVQQIAGHG